MNARFGIIAGLTIALYACKGDTDEGLFLTDTSAALDCGAAGSSACTFSSSSQPGAPKPDDSYHDDDGYDDEYEHHAGAPDAGAPCAYDDDCAPGERCERQHGASHCAPHDDHGYSGSGGSDGDDDDQGYSGNGGDDDHGDDDSKPTTPDATPPACDDGYDCDYDRSGSNSGPH